jgi:hypothetical protein
VSTSKKPSRTWGQQQRTAVGSWAGKDEARLNAVPTQAHRGHVLLLLWRRRRRLSRQQRRRRRQLWVGLACGLHLVNDVRGLVEAVHQSPMEGVDLSIQHDAPQLVGGAAASRGQQWGRRPRDGDFHTHQVGGAKRLARQQHVNTIDLAIALCLSTHNKPPNQHGAGRPALRLCPAPPPSLVTSPRSFPPRGHL